MRKIQKWYKTGTQRQVPQKLVYKLSPFFRTTLTWGGKVAGETKRYEKLKILLSVFSFYKPVARSTLQEILDEELEDLIWYDSTTISGYEEEQVSHDEIDERFYRVRVSVDDEIIRKKDLY